MKINSLLFVAVLAYFLTSCGGHELDCVKSSGKETQMFRTLENFDTIDIQDAFDITLHQDTACYAIVLGAENIISNIGLTIVNNTLFVTDENSCGWMKPRKNKVHIQIAFANLSRLYVRRTCTIRSDNAITGNELGLILMDKVQDIDLQLNLNTFYYWNMPPCGGRLNLSGNCSNLKIWNWALIGIDTRQLYSEQAFIYSESIGDIHVRSNSYLYCSISNRGNVYYYGHPASVELVDEGEGELIQAD